MTGSGNTNILMAGVGGQGVLLASEVLALAAAYQGKEVKQTEVHGVAQRGGSVVSHVRYGDTVYSPVIQRGQADLVVAFEQLEGLRYAHYLRPGGLLILNRERIQPGQMGEKVPYPEGIEEYLAAKDFQVLPVPAAEVAISLGNKRVSSMVLLGVTARFLDLSGKAWEETLAGRIPARLLEINRQAFAAGQKLAAAAPVTLKPSA